MITSGPVTGGWSMVLASRSAVAALFMAGWRMRKWAVRIIELDGVGFSR